MVSNGNSDVVERHNLHAHSGGIQAIENGGLSKTADDWNSNATSPDISSKPEISKTG
jgi:hypothetical protein